MPLDQKQALWEHILVRDRAKQFLMRSVAQKKLSHAYLFLGPACGGKKQAAQAFAQAILCKHGGCGTCEDCERVKRGSHPDYQRIRPQGAAAYLIEQIRELIADINRSPIRSNYKIYEIEHAELLGQTCANALLKTLEEPPEDVILIVHAPSKFSVLPTIFSRCQPVNFSAIPIEVLVSELKARAQVSEELARLSLASCSYSLEDALEFCGSQTRQALRRELISFMLKLPNSEEFEILSSIKTIMERLQLPLKELEARQSEQLKQDEDFLSKSMMKEVQVRHKRELSACRLSYMLELLVILRSCMRDLIDLGSDLESELQNPDIRPQLLAFRTVCTPAALASCVDLIEKADQQLRYSQNYTLVFELLFFDMREVLSCP